MKIFNFGMTRTGTTSLLFALRKLGYDAPLGVQLFKKFFDKHEVFVGDTMFFVKYKWLLENYPDSIFLLTIRKDSETWFRSLNKWSLKGRGNSLKHKRHSEEY